MKIMQINSVCGFGSTGRIVVDIHNELKRNGTDSYIVYGRKKCQMTENVIKVGTVFNFIEHLVLPTLFDLHGYGSKKETMKLIRKIEDIDPDLIHLHNIHGYYINIEILFNYLKQANKKIVWTLHDCWSFTGHCAYFDYSGCNRWEEECFNCPEKNSYPISLGLDNSKNNYNNKKELFTGLSTLTIVTPSIWLKDLVSRSYLKDYPVKVINNGVDLVIFKYTENDIRRKFDINDKFVILGVANVWDRRKGLKYFKQLSKALCEDEVIILIGVNSVKKIGLPSNIITIKRTTNIHELIDIYSSADVFVNTTLEDNFPTTNIEALACGLPVITFATGGSVESVDEEIGYIVEKGNVQQLISAIKSIRKSKKNYKSTCRMKADKKYDKIERIKDYTLLYENLIKNKLD